MITVEDFDPNSLEDLEQTFEHIAKLDADKAKLATHITQAIEYACVTWRLSKPAVKAAFKWWGMSEGERQDWEESFEQCKAAVRKNTQPDLFSSDFEAAIDAVVAEKRKANKMSAEQIPAA